MVATVANQPKSPLPAAGGHLRERIETEQINAIYRQYPIIALGGTVGASVLVFMMWDVVPHPTLLWWLGIVSVVQLSCFGLTFLWYQGATKSTYDLRKWKIVLHITGASVALSWGLTGILFFVQESLVYQLLILIWIWTILGMMAFSMVAYRPAFYSLLVPTLMPITVRLAAEMDPLHLGLAAGSIIYGAMQVYFHQNGHKTLSEALRLKYENVDLVKMLTLQKERAEQANLDKSRFLAAASHDLRQPLHAQGLFLTELDYYVDHPRGRKILGGLESSVHAMARLFNALLDISKLDAGIIEPEVSVFRITLLLQEIQQEFMSQAEELGIDLRIVVSRVAVRSDQALLGSILRNFVSNALRYTHHGRILVGCRRRGSDIEIQVWDTGIGIPSSQLKEIFQEFHQIGNPERDREKGLGLGLAIAKRTSQLLVHPIQVKSSPGKGSMFSVTVPLASMESIINEDLDKSVSEIDSIVGSMILVIDDEIAVRQGMQGVLTKWGCHVVDVASADEALKMLTSAKRPDLIIADYRLRDNCTGIEAISLIQEQFDFQIPAVLITGDTAPERLREADTSGYPILHKPVSSADLRRFLIRCLSDRASNGGKPRNDH